ncbi:class I SAM-dependent methyltransferase [Streptacidiphilus neutrinimicus]|uniref:class I SAM-dependent methyltransferase n=1 Tax=Streptacidiphilus neutrinimicus TaxID=105420 RepID=UPI0005AAE6DB|nr:methyltransferase domain-containing protein [Streptacidiphilus neutrinimicus]
MQLSDFSPAPNQGGNPELYETENRAVDPGGLVLDALAKIAPWQGRTLVDLGCGSGYWLGSYADAAEVIGVEPDPTLVPRAAARSASARVLHGSAEHVPLPDASVDVVHARFAYFWPPRCERGLREVLRVLRPGGTLVVIDNDWRNGEFAALLRACAGSAAMGGGDRTDAWWSERGAERTEVLSSWAFDSRADLEAVLRMEFPDGTADAWLEQHPEATGLSYGFVLFSVRRG